MKQRQSNQLSGGSRVCIGIHTSIAGGVSQSPDRAHELGCDGFQIFSANPRTWAGGDIDADEARRFAERRETLGLYPVVIHCNYLINLATAQPLQRTRALQAFKNEVARAEALGADFLVLHPGSATGQERLDAVRNLITSLRGVLQGFPKRRVQVLLENTAGQGSVLGADLKELAFLVDALRDVRVGACLDTAHLHGAGYEVRTEAGVDDTLATVEATVGLDKVKVIHLNDSKVEFGARVDRHENIGKGKIGSDGLRMILRHPTLRDKPFILETPVDKPGDDLRNLQAARRLADSATRPKRSSAGAKRKTSKKRAARGKTVRKSARNRRSK